MINDIMRGILDNLCFLMWFVTLVILPKKQEREKQAQRRRFNEWVITVYRNHHKVGVMWR